MLSNSVILRLFSLGAFLIAVRLFLADLPDQYSFLPILPFFCAIFYLMSDFFVGKKDADVATLLVLSLVFVRCCFLPLLTFYGNFFAETSWNFTQLHFNKAIFLMTYESFAIFFALVLANEVRVDKPRNIVLLERDSVIKPMMVAAFSFIVVVFVLYPETFNLFNSILQLNQLEFTQGTRIDKAEVGSVKRVVLTCFSVIFFVFRVVFPVYVLRECSKKNKSSFVFISLALFFIALQFVFITATFAESIVCSLTILLCANKINPNVGKKLVRISPVFVACVIVAYFYVRYLVSLSNPYKSMYNGVGIFEYLSALFNAYFTGPFNVAGSFMPVDDNYWSVFYSTYVGTIPFNSTLLGARGFNVQSVYNMFNHSYGQIPSTIGNGLYFFNSFFSPVFSFILTFYSVLFCRMAKMTKSYLRYLCFIYSSIIFALGIAMYNEHISLIYFNQWFVPVFLMSVFCEKKMYIEKVYEIKS